MGSQKNNKKLFGVLNDWNECNGASDFPLFRRLSRNWHVMVFRFQVSVVFERLTSLSETASCHRGSR